MRPSAPCVRWQHISIDASGPIWLTWWLGDFVSALVITPFILVWAGGLPPTWRVTRAVEAVILLALVVLVGQIVFGQVNADHRPLAFLVIPILVWAAYRFHHHGAVTTSVVISTIAIAGTLRGSGSFAGETPNTSLLIMQAFLGVVAMTVLVLAALMAQQLRVETSLRDAEAQSHAIVDAAVDGIITIGERGIVESVNPSVERLFGYRADEIVGHNVKMLMPPSYADEHDSYLSNYLRTGVRKIIGIGRQVQGRRRDGSLFPIELAVSEVRTGGRRIFTGIIHDMSDYKKAEQEREILLQREREAREETERASRAKDQFIAVLSHELRTPLTPVLLTIDALAQDQALPSDLRDQLALVRQNVELEARLIDDLLDLTRIARGKLQLNLETHDLHALIKNAVQICGGNGRIRFDIDLSAPRHYVRGDSARLQQVFWNLLTNACKFTDVGGTVTIQSRNGENGSIVVDVTDTGIGIEPELLPRLFDAFQQGEAAQIVRKGGLGLGLAISRALVVAHGGELSAFSAGKGHGAKFTVRLATVASAKSRGAGGPDAARGGPPMRILLVEDDPATLDVLHRLLKTRGHTVTTANAVAVAKQAAESAGFDLLISDLGLPDGSGDELMRDLKARYGMQGIALSGYGMDADVKKSLDAGFAEHLTKPLDLGALERAMYRVRASAAMAQGEA